jgi:hypothetical protein
VDTTPSFQQSDNQGSFVDKMMPNLTEMRKTNPKDLGFGSLIDSPSLHFQQRHAADVGDVHFKSDVLNRDPLLYDTL